MRTTGRLDPVLIVGSGLIGASVGLALRRRGLAVHLHDTDPAVARVAASLGAGTDAALPSEPRLVIVAVPPQHLGNAVAEALTRWGSATVTDVGSVKVAPLRQAARHRSQLDRYVGSHPMAGSERSGPWAAAADLFEGRAWAVVPHEQSSLAAIGMVEEMAVACGAYVVRITPHEHDVAVARVSHLPHVLAALAAARLTDAPKAELALSGQGLRDVTRVASGDPSLWSQILAANPGPVMQLLEEVRADLDRLLGALESCHGHECEVPDTERVLSGPIGDLLVRAACGTDRIRHTGTDTANTGLADSQ